VIKPWSPAVLGTLSLLAGCSGDQVTPELPAGKWLDEVDPQAVLATEMCRTPEPGASPLRRLTNAEYRNTLEELGLPRDEIDEATATLPSEPISLGFRNGARTLNVDTLMAQEYARVAKKFSNRLAPACADAEAERDCAESFVLDLGRRLHRRPLEDEQTTNYLAIYDAAQAGGDAFGSAIAWVVEAMLQSPHFLYRVEIPEVETARVTGYEMASRLSYTFWQSPPDEALLDAAEAGDLDTDEGVEDQARRLLSSGRALRVYEFFEQWLDLDELTTVDRDVTLYPDLPSNLAQLLRAENRAFVEDLLHDGDSTLTDLLTAEHTFANAALSDHYGLDGPAGDVFERVDAPGRRGILTQGMLAVQDASTRTSMVRRGLKIRTDFLCQTVPAPPDNVDLTLDGVGADLSQAARLELHRDKPGCIGCHEMMDPIGVAFDAFDAVGRPRTTDEYGAPIVTGGEFVSTMDIDGPVDSVDTVALALAGSRELEQCYLVQNFRFFFGREAERRDLCSQAQLTDYFQASGQSLAELFVGLARTDAFLYKAGRSDEDAEESP
jgi:hypothetical protein